MVVKTITITEEAYKILKNMKGEGDSFSDTILKIGAKRVPLRNYFGSMPDLDIQEARKRFKNIREEISKDVNRHARS